MSVKLDLNYTLKNLDFDNDNDSTVYETVEKKKDGKPVKDENGQAVKEQIPLTLKRVLLTLIPVYPEKEKMVECWDLGLKVKNNEGEVEFEKAEFNLIREIVEKNHYPNPMDPRQPIDRYYPFIIAQLKSYFNKVELEKSSGKS